MPAEFQILPPAWLTEAHPHEALLLNPAEAALIRALRAEPALETLRWEVGHQRFERWLLIEALRRQSGNVRQTARALGISARGLYLRLARLDIDPKRFRRLAPPPHQEAPARTEARVHSVFLSEGT